MIKEITQEIFESGEKLVDGDFVRIVHRRDENGNAIRYEDKHYHEQPEQVN